MSVATENLKSFLLIPAVEEDGDDDEEYYMKGKQEKY